MSSGQKVGLVLSGGGTRGMAHIGALKVLSRIGFEPAAIAGCSIGALIGAMYAAGRTPAEIEKFAINQRVFSLLQMPISRLGLSNLTKMEKTMTKFIGVDNFEDLNIPLIINSTDLAHAEEVTYTNGSIWAAIRASISIPGLMSPVRGHDRIEVDGGVLDQHPFRILPPGVRRFVMVDTSPPTVIKAKKLNLVHILQTSMAIMQNEMTRLRLEELPANSYVVIQPELVSHNLIEGEKKFKQLIERGAAATREVVPAIRQLINK